MLRLFSARGSDDFDISIGNSGDYVRAIEQKISSETISKVLYPPDAHEAGRELRLLQEHFLVACALRDIIRRYRRRHGTFDLLPARAAIQLNDTQPALAIPELMRQLVDEHGLAWNTAWTLTKQTFSYTSQSLQREALEACRCGSSACCRGTCRSSPRSTSASSPANRSSCRLSRRRAATRSCGRSVSLTKPTASRRDADADRVRAGLSRGALAERIIPAADLAEQIATAGTDAASTSPMKFVLNGALTIGTLDGANVEIRQEVGTDSIYIFGLTADDVARLHQDGYDPRAWYQTDPAIARVLDAIRDGRFSPREPDLFQPLVSRLLNDGDGCMLLADFKSYRDAQQRALEEFGAAGLWSLKAILDTTTPASSRSIAPLRIMLARSGASGPYDP